MSRSSRRHKTTTKDKQEIEVSDLNEDDTETFTPIAKRKQGRSQVAKKAIEKKKARTGPTTTIDVSHGSTDEVKTKLECSEL